MNDETLRQQLQQVQGEEPSPEFLQRLRLEMHQQSSSELELLPPNEITEPSRSAGHADPARRRSVPIWPVAAAAALVAVVLLAWSLPDDGAPLETAAATEAQQVGDAWLASIIENDKSAFVALHAADLETNDTLMAYSRDVELLTPARVSELYFDGFDAFQVSLSVDDDFVRSDGCEGIDRRQVRCSYTASMIGTSDYTYSVAADLTVENRMVTNITFSEISTQPADLRSEVEGFFAEAANDEDRACLFLGFNTSGCGEHDSDFMRRYVAYYEAQQSPTDE